MLVRWTVRDGVRATAPLFYATPPALLAGGAAVVLAAALTLGRRRIAIPAAAFLAAGAVTVVPQWQSASAALSNPPPSDVRPLRGIFWNVEHGRRGWDGCIAWARSRDPDVLWIAEGPGPRGPEIEAWRRAFPGHAHVYCGGHLHVFARGRAEVAELRSPGARGARAALVRIETAGRRFESIVVDLPSRPLVDRRPLLDRIREWAAGVRAPLVVAGDFNTPPDATGFDAWRGPLRHAFESAGAGWRPTWPMPVPVLELDHVWGNDGVTFRRAEHGISASSDHRAVIFDFDVR